MCHVQNIIMNTTKTPVQHHSSRTSGLPPPSQVCTAKERVTRHYSHRQYGPQKFAVSHRVTNFISCMEVKSTPNLTPSDRAPPLLRAHESLWTYIPYYIYFNLLHVTHGILSQEGLSYNKAQMQSIPIQWTSQWTAQKYNHTVRFKVLMAISIKIMVFCDMTLTFVDI
jgi:hypothetical protein